MLAEAPIRLFISLVLVLGVLSVVKANPTANGSKITWDTFTESKWKSNINLKMDDRGLMAWYNLGNSFINSVLSKDPYVIMREVISGEKPISEDPVNRFVLDYGLGLVICAGFGILFVLLMPIVGLCFCCCRLCNNCGGEMSQKDLPANACKRSVFGAILSLIVLLMFTGVLLTFVCNDNMSHSIGNSKKTMDGIVDEAVGFINKTFNDFDNIIDKDFGFVATLLSTDISDPGVKLHLGDPLLKELDGVIKAPLDAVTKLAINSKLMEKQLEVIKGNTLDLQTQSGALSSGLTEAKDNLTSIVTECNGISPALSFCDAVDTSQFAQDANFTNLENVTSQLNDLKEVTGKDFAKAAQEGYQTFRDIPMTMINKTSNTRNDIIKMISNATTQVKKILTDARKTVDDGVIKQLKDAQKQSDQYSEYGNTYDKYRWYAGVGLTCLLLLIVVLMALGLMCGICGHDKEATPTTRGTVSSMGGNCLMAAVGFCFLFASFLMLLTTICFLIGAPMQRIICEPIQSGAIFKEVLDNPNTYSNKKLPLAELLGGNGSASIKIGESLDNCRANKPAYTALNLVSLYNISSELNIKKLLGDSVDNQLNHLKVNFSDQTLLTTAARDSLKILNDSAVQDINFDSFLNETKKGITKTNLTVLANQLYDLATNFSKVADADPTNAAKLYDLGNRTQKIADHLVVLDQNTVQQMKSKADELGTNVEGLKSIGGQLSIDAQNTLNAADKAEKYLHNDAAPAISEIVGNYSSRVLGWGYQFTDHILDLLDNSLGRCKPLTNIFDGIVVYLCNDLLYPFNGFWLSIGFCLFFFIPAMIFSVKLAKHYRCMKYESDFDQEGTAGVEAYEMAQPPSYHDSNIGQEKKLWANPNGKSKY